MADNKRASMNSRVAIPRVTSSQSSQAPQGPQLLRDDASIMRAIGAKIRIVTTSNPPRTYEGHLFSAHTPSNLLTLTPTYPPPANTTPALTVLPISSIHNLTVTSYYQSPQSSSPNTPTQQQQQQQQQQQHQQQQPQPNSAPSSAAKPPQQQQPLQQQFSLLSLPPPLPPLLDAATQQARLRASIARVQAEDSRRGKGVSKEAQEIFDALSRTLPAQWDGENIIVLGQVLIAKPYRVEDCKAGKEVQVQMVQRIKKVLENERKKIAERSGVAFVRKGG